ncbi:hypothetical protein O181_096136 [Austropuccinia psidii MF-1]|uniref:Uncharacterized protein n=1 Tax=Austropuccinia psidii MF-1 TaxID=1389203 RepID=A0A9Q3J6H3_9BASI|nr:hypothetical protein [Austropuccinia psidii MF-1]
MPVILANKCTGNIPFFPFHSNNKPRDPMPHAHVRTPSLLKMMRECLRNNGTLECFHKISPVPSSIDFSTPPSRKLSNGHFTHGPELNYSTTHEGW